MTESKPLAGLDMLRRALGLGTAAALPVPQQLTDGTLFWRLGDKSAWLTQLEDGRVRIGVEW